MRKEYWAAVLWGLIGLGYHWSLYLAILFGGLGLIMLGTLALQQKTHFWLAVWSC